MTSIVIPTLNASKQIGDLVASLQSQTVACEVIVIDSSSSDGTARLAESAGARVITISGPEFDHGGSRTLAGRKCGGDIIIYMTQDVLPVNEVAVERLLSAFADKRVGSAYGRQMPYPDASLFVVHSRLFNYPGHSCIRSLDDGNAHGIKAPFLSNAFAAYRKSALDEIGWFKENLISTEDTYAGARLLVAGYKLAYVHDAMVYHSHNYSVIEEFKRYFDIGVFHKNEAWILEKFGKAKGEGMRYLRSEIEFLLKKKKFHLIPEFCIRNGLKFAGYTLGRNYEKIPTNVIRKLSRNRIWWDKMEN